jgi:putative oxidoreductase
MPAYWATIERIILGLFFLSSGIGKIIGEPGAMQEMIRHGFPMVTTLYWATAIFETVVGGALLLGIATAWSSALLALFTLLTALTIHTFWNDPAGSMERMNNLINFEKNLAIIGGLLVLAGLGPAPYSLRLGHHEGIDDHRAHPGH